MAGAAVLRGLVDAVLVHGAIRPPGSDELTATYLHAWVVLADGQIWEPTQARIWNPRVFEFFMEPVVNNTYSHAEAYAELLRTGHWGHWR